MAQREFCLKHLPDDLIFKYVDVLFRVVPRSRAAGEGQEPVAQCGCTISVIQWYYGVKEYDFYTVLFGVGRAIGVAATLSGTARSLPDRAAKSVTTAMLEEVAAKK